MLNEVVDWLDHWESLKHDAGRLTRETHSAPRHTSHALVEGASYCLEEHGFTYVVHGKFQNTLKTYWAGTGSCLEHSTIYQ